MVLIKKNLMLRVFLATLATLSITHTNATFLNSPRSGKLTCDKSCMSYCVAYYPTSGCLDVCGCLETELGRVLYQRPSRLSMVATPSTPSYDPTIPGTP